MAVMLTGCYNELSSCVSVSQDYKVLRITEPLSVHVMFICLVYFLCYT